MNKYCSPIYILINLMDSLVSLIKRLMMLKILFVVVISMVNFCKIGSKDLLEKGLICVWEREREASSVSIIS